MIDKLYALPELLLIALSAGTLAIAVTLLPRLLRRVPFMVPTDASFEFVIRMQAPLFTMTALILAFTLIEAERNFRQIDSNVTAEGSQLNQLDRLLTRYDDPAAVAARPLLLAYASSIVESDWPAMLRGESGSDKTRLAFVPLSRAVLALDPKPGRQSLIYAEMLKALDSLAESRDRRLDTVQVGLPSTYWDVIVFSILMLLFVSSTVQRTPFRSAVLAAQLAVMGALLGFVFIMDAPFNGETAITPASISKAIAVMERREK
jgi:hypothetical protein